MISTSSPADVEALVEREEELRAALITCGRHAGAFLADDVSTDFLMHVPEEVRLKIASLASPDTSALREALEDIGRSRCGLQNICADHGHDTNAYNYHAMRYFASVTRELQAIARAALSTGGAK